MHSASRFAIRPRRQDGQALIYGLFMVVAGLVAVFFVFNTGQLTAEKTKLVNTADAVAYSAGILHARALNFDAYTNRALMANEVMIAQTVSLASWVQYAQGHVEGVPPLNCYEVVYSVPVWLSLAKYTPLCTALSWPPGAMAVQYAAEAVQPVAKVAVQTAEAARKQLQLAQTVMFASLVPARTALMREVADANYANDGSVEVDPVPLTDQWTLFDGGFFVSRYTGNDRSRFREAALTAANRDGFVSARTWHDESAWPCIPAPPRGKVAHDAGTTLQGYDDWKAQDKGGLTVESFHTGLFDFGCKTDTHYGLGEGSQSAADWGYSGVPNFYDLSAKALAYGPDNADASRRDPRLRFAIRLTRAASRQRTSAGTSSVRPAGQMAIYAGKQAGQVMAAVATSEVYFDRPPDAVHAYGRSEIASLFSPYWQVHLVGNSTADLAKAMALQGGGQP